MRTFDVWGEGMGEPPNVVITVHGSERLAVARRLNQSTRGGFAHPLQLQRSTPSVRSGHSLLSPCARCVITSTLAAVRPACCVTERYTGSP